MSRETPDEPLGAAEQHWRKHWQKTLREPDALPGQGLADKDAAWDKLFARLNARSRRSLRLPGGLVSGFRITGGGLGPFSAYRIAVACILVTLIPVSRLFHDRPGAVRPAAATEFRVTPPLRSPATLTVTTSVAPATAASGGPKGRKRNPVTDRAGSIGVKAFPTAPVAAPPAPIAPPAAIPAPPANILAESMPPAPVAPPKPAAKKQWKVVDINELEPRYTRPPMVADRRPGLLRLGIGLGDPGFPESSQAREDRRLKIDLSTQNH